MFLPCTFGKYVLLKRIATGGMAEVFRAKVFGTDGFEKIVAIKRILSHLSADQHFVDMFVNEANLIASLNHTNIAQVYDFGNVEQTYFISMEYVKGKDLSDLIRVLREKGLTAPIEIACQIIIEALAGLDYAHRKTDSYGNALNLMHRDLSPHNLLVSYEGEIKIVDFGIAKATSTTIETTMGVLKGKYSYMSPEQARGAKLDHRTDIFTLGICFYELLTLRKMFYNPSDLKLLEQVSEADFIRPREINPAIPRKLESLLLKALAKNPNDRWQTASDWRKALEDYLFANKLHCSPVQLSDFMIEIFHEDMERELSELAQEADLAEEFRSRACRIAQLETNESVIVANNADEPDYGEPDRSVPLFQDSRYSVVSSIDIVENLDASNSQVSNLSDLADSVDDENLATVLVGGHVDPVKSFKHNRWNKPTRILSHNTISFVIQGFLTAATIALGIAAAKLICTLIPLVGFNLNF